MVVAENLQGESKMAQVASLFGKKLNERFTIEMQGSRYGGRFTVAGLDVVGCENPFLDMDCYFLEALLIGQAVIVDEAKGKE